jgi:hypothetical protein
MWLVIRQHVQALVSLLQLRSGSLLSQYAMVYCLGANANHKSPHIWSLLFVPCLVEDRGSTVVKVLHYKSEGRWFNPRWCLWNFSLT